eukprot:CCRYP_004889-RA/>CCRYP_004889-RA protein AED:0.03 eAED:0.03 QI:201/1/1/1/1/0.75/4/730/816
MSASPTPTHAECCQCQCTHQSMTRCRRTPERETNCGRFGVSLSFEKCVGRTTSQSFSSRRNRKMMHALSSSHLTLRSPRWFLLACSSFLLLLSPTTNVSGASLPDADDMNRKFLRNSIKAQTNNNGKDDDASPDNSQDEASGLRRLLVQPSTPKMETNESGTQLKDDTGQNNDPLSDINKIDASNHRRLLFEPSPYEAEADDSKVLEDGEEYDYERYHSQLDIPLPAIGASLMGLVRSGIDEENRITESHIFAFAGTNEAMKRLAIEENDQPRRILLSDKDRDNSQMETGKRLFAFAGTNQAIKQLATAERQDDSPAEIGRRMLLPVDDEELVLDSTSYATTLSQITQSRSTMLWGPQSESYSDDESTVADVELSSFGSSLHALKTPRHATPMLERSPSDLDRGRYLLGLEVREIQSHQQILLDYETAARDGRGTSRHPIRVRYVLSHGAADVSANELLILSQLLETSFPAAADTWFHALRVIPVPNKIYPTVETCGAATIPASDRENGVEEADIVIYVSSDNRFCGGALMHSAVCDFDQFTRPLVGNINICTKNFPESVISQDTMISSGSKTTQDSTLSEYAGYLTTETGRILGASTSLFRYYLDPQSMTRYGTTEKSLSCVDGTEETMEVPNIITEAVDKDGHHVYEIRTPRVTEVVRNHFDCMVLRGARLKDGKDSISCFGGFLDDYLYYSEEMTGFDVSSTKGPSISSLTLALLEDSSWYVANYQVSVETSFGRGAGCQFAGSRCQMDETNEELDDDYSGFHCSEIGEMGCDASHSYKAKCDFVDSMVGKRIVFITSMSPSVSYVLFRGLVI